eukprot:IDg22352t1
MVAVVCWPIEKTCTTRNKYSVTLLLATCVVLWRYACTKRWVDGEKLLYKQKEQLSEIFWEEAWRQRGTKGGVQRPQMLALSQISSYHQSGWTNYTRLRSHGRFRHDITMWRPSGLEEQLCEVLLIEGVQYNIYGDAAYSRQQWMGTPAQGANVSAKQKASNQDKSTSRDSVK